MPFEADGLVSLFQICSGYYIIMPKFVIREVLKVLGTFSGWVDLPPRNATLYTVAL